MKAPFNGFLQVRLFDSQYYIKAFGVGDVWVAVGWSSDILPAARRMSNVAIVVPKSGASLWADLWVRIEIFSDHFQKKKKKPRHYVALNEFKGKYSNIFAFGSSVIYDNWELVSQLIMGKLHLPQ